MANNPSLPFQDRLVLIVGGSKGIGKETAKQVARLGGSVCLVARQPEALAQAAADVRSAAARPDQLIEVIAADATDRDDLGPKLMTFIEMYGLPDYLINAVGYAYPNYLARFTLEDFEENMRVNYYGQLVPTQVLVPLFRERGSGHISFISSIMGYMGMVGYATYAPSKFAIVGLAETLRHELKPDNISISVLYPPDTDTPGFERENQTKPPETMILSESAKLYKPDVVAEKYVQDLLKGKFYIMVGSGKWIWLLFRLFPRLVHAVMDSDYQKARRKVQQTGS
jgi:3-dehydrosphinganine reductase